MPRPLARVLALLELLQSGGVRTVPELAGRLGVDERTVRRYAGHLLDLDVPVESVRGRYGGYRLAPGYRMPPLMLTDEEALAVLLGLAAGRRAGPAGVTATAGETAAAKIRRVLPERTRLRLDALLGSLAFTAPPGGTPAPDAAVLLACADAVAHHRPVTVRYTAADGRSGERTLHPHGLVAHAGRLYLTATEPATGEERVFRLDRMDRARVLPGSFTPPAGPDPARRLLTSLATAPYRHEVSLRVRGTAERIHAGLPPSVAVVTELPPADGDDAEAGRWHRVTLRVERLDWLPGVLASLDLPFVVERPAALRGLVTDLAGRLLDSAGREA
ncbi:helix-turn-helix transcriptional regulator [Streptomyces daghestanicus]|uniref:Transcriptional regulator n=1 Tax=Streptomyces daghestanicus TaxID=66885 RepID=A0ABQ3Q6U1_9ACTN|nr:WYL domain-containing protein [Streptomyces daghestanicus]GGU30537.1 transcriptional regulator [Streptomyces daghestanicus]GHI33007.1 transcriptional regulator [Streptomyces daghestanicus]